MRGRTSWTLGAVMGAVLILAASSYAQQAPSSPAAVLNPTIANSGAASGSNAPAALNTSPRNAVPYAPLQTHTNRPMGQSSFGYVHHGNDAPVYRHPQSRITVVPQDGVSYWVAPNAVYWVSRDPTPQPARVWVPGHYTWRERTVWVQGQWHEEYIPPMYERSLLNGRQVLVQVAEERVERYFVPAHYETVREQVWVPGHWEYVW
ncbi:MAG: hypothetical protein GY851_00640 [bacterium]|nr:hypothetical protein [bacterium]